MREKMTARAEYTEAKRKKEQLVVEEMIRQVMRFSGPRMLLYHPALALWHVACSVREKRKQRERMGKTG